MKDQETNLFKSYEVPGKKKKKKKLGNMPGSEEKGTYQTEAIRTIGGFHINCKTNRSLKTLPLHESKTMSPKDIFLTC